MVDHTLNLKIEKLQEQVDQLKFSIKMIIGSLPDIISTENWSVRNKKINDLKKFLDEN